jgi:hypothetical protein
MTNRFVFESLFAGDLKGTIFPEFEFSPEDPVVMESGFTLAFYFISKKASEDMCAFLANSPILEIVSCRADDIPDENGRWRCLIELDGESTPDTVQDVLKLMEILCGEQHWKIFVPSLNKSYTANKKNIAAAFSFLLN